MAFGKPDSSVVTVLLLACGGGLAALLFAGNPWLRIAGAAFLFFGMSGFFLACGIRILSLVAILFRNRK